MNDPHDNHSHTEERFDELLHDIASSAPTETQWNTAHNRLRRRLAEQAQSSVLSPQHFIFWRMLAYGFGAAAVLALIAVPFMMMSGRPAMAADMSSPGQLIVLGPNGAPAGICPLEHTDVEADIAGFITRVKVKQAFSNPFDKPIEAVYEFPLPNGSAVDEMTMHIGSRVIVGQVKEKQEARQIYNQARASGQRAALLEQQRPNMFTQSVANIQPGERIEIEIGYNEVLDYTDGRFEFVFPMVIAPRYDSRPAAQGDASHTPDGAPVKVPYTEMASTAPVTRSGHDISVTVKIAAGGMQINELKSRLHDVVIERPGFNQAVVTLRNRSEIPNRHFVLDYTMTSDEIGDSLFLRDDPRGRFFTLILAPPKRVTPKDAVPRELIFVIDQSGSMGGWKIEKAKLAMRRCIQNLNPGDTFNLLSFSGGIGRCFDNSVAVTELNIKAAMAYLDSMNAGGGTEMMPAIMEALSKQQASESTRIVGFMSDGEVGNDFEILSAVKQNAGTSRVFTFGVGDSVNRFLLETMAKTSRGEVQWVTEKDTPEATADRFYVSLNAPVLTDVKLDWQGIEVEDVTPPLLPDLFDRKPIMIHGRIKKGSPTTGTLTLSGMTGAGPMRRVIKIPAEAAPTDNAALPSLWARSRVEQIMLDNPVELQSGQFSPATREKILGLGIEFHLMTQFTSFVAVEKNPYAPKAEPVRVNVPAAKPQGEPEEAFGGFDHDGDEDVVLFSTDNANAGMRYDPSNGTISYGDVYRFEGNPQPAAAAPISQTRATSEYAPTLKDLPDIVVGDAENSSSHNVFVFPDSINLNAKVSDDMTSPKGIIWTYSESGGRHTIQMPPELSKLDPALREIAIRADQKTTDTQPLVLMVALTDRSPETMKTLASLGFVIDPELDKHMVAVAVGRLPRNRLMDLARLHQVISIKRFVAVR